MITNNHPQIIISLTTFPARINKVHLVIECLLRQTYDNLRFILWLSKNQFPDETIPNSLKRLIDYGLEIRFVEGDIRSHKKYYYAFNEFKDSLVFLADDDIFYPSWMVEDSYNKFILYGAKKIVIGHWGYKMLYESNGNLKSYNSWSQDFSIEDPNLFFGSGGGTLIRPCELYEDCCDKDLLLKLAPTADDIWLNAMCRLAGVKVFVNLNYHMPIIIKNNIELRSVNYLENQNDVILKQISDYYIQQLGVNPFQKQL